MIEKGFVEIGYGSFVLKIITKNDIDQGGLARLSSEKSSLKRTWSINCVLSCQRGMRLGYRTLTKPGQRDLPLGFLAFGYNTRTTITWTGHY